ncbi:MAG: HAD hydrolase family protein [Clostridia bacterium]|nr:HAD hydrolase family protein [Clostridia bacterium]
MKDILFLCDLDDTLLYSFRHKNEGDVCVEIIDGKQHGYMPPEVYNGLCGLSRKVEFIPLTTRSEEQFKRIKWAEGVEINYALVANGARLLVNGTADGEWEKIYDRIYKPFNEEILALYGRLLSQTEYSVKIVDKRYIQVNCKTAEGAQKFVCDFGQNGSLACVASGKKVYFYPQVADKGEAVRLIKARLNNKITIAAGDSDADVNMLSKADYAVAHERLKKYFPEDLKTVFYGCGNFPQFVIKSVGEILGQVKL